MNKCLVWLPVLIVAGVSIYKPAKEAYEEKPVNKSVSFAVYKSSAYTSAAYNNTSAQVHIIVEKTGTKGTSVVWDTTLNSRVLKDFPSLDKAQYQNILIPGINPCKEHLQVNYILTYNSKGNELQMQENAAVSNNGTTKVDISI